MPDAEVALRGRRSRRILGAVLLLLGACAIAAYTLGRPSSPTVDRARPGSTVSGAVGLERLSTHITTWQRLDEGRWPAESADYQATYVPESGAVLYRSRAAYSSSCGPRGSASIDRSGSLTLTLSEDPAAAGDCTADATIVVAVVRGIPDGTPLRSLTVTEPDGTLVATVMERVHDVSGWSADRARRTLEHAGLDVRVERARCRADVGCPETVVDTVPAPDTAVPIGSSVILVTQGR